MGQSYHLSQVNIVNEGEIKTGDIIISDGIISKIEFGKKLQTPTASTFINGEGLHLLPGIIDDHVHFREPGMEDLAEISTESKAAVAGGVTSFMDMPNTKPPAVTLDCLEDKYDRASRKSMANYSFYLGTNNENYDEVMRASLKNICGIKMFLASSTGKLLINDEKAIENIFKNTGHIIAAHCEDEETIVNNTNYYKSLKPNEIDSSVHPLIRTDEAAYIGTNNAVQLARKFNTRLHVLHISSAKELDLFDNTLPLHKKRITAEACVHHLWFTSDFYATKENFIKVNPSIKSADDRHALRMALRNGLIDVVATDHAPHLIKNKTKDYFDAPSGAPMIQHSLQAMISLSKNGLWDLTDIAKLMAHNPATLFNIKGRGFIREGYYADLALVNLKEEETVSYDNTLYKCNWSPLEGTTLSSRVEKTFVNGNLVYDQGRFFTEEKGMRLEFERE
ncbi:MAG: dihydroorotase [Marinilabiliales bacterium]|nr:MAG: dihydroorotase [Marinilabiliales bacterium]